MSIGQHITLTTADGKTFNGTLTDIDDQSGKVALKNVLTNDCKLPDLQTFYASDIKDLTFTECYGFRSKSSESLLDHVTRVPGKFMRPKDSPAHLLNNPGFNGEKMLLSSIAIVDDDGLDQGIGSGEDAESFEDFYETDDYLLFCRPCEKFREAIVYLMKQEYVAVVFLGVEIGRKGTLSIMQVATEEYTFLFDMLRLGDEGFIDGLQELLESQDVVKIIHDCRMMSDLLSHQFNVSLSNVFDTQVAAVFVYRARNEGDWPRSVESLPTSLMNHLGFSEKEIHIAFKRERSRKLDEEVWLQRPLSKPLLSSTLKNLSKLIPLYHFMWEKLMLPFKIGVDIYLDQVRGAPEGIADKQRINSHLLPHAFQDLEKTIAYSSREMKLNSTLRSRFVTYDHKGFKENLVRLIPNKKKVITSRDSIWHASRESFPSSRGNMKSRPSGGVPAELKAVRNRDGGKTISFANDQACKDSQSQESTMRQWGKLCDSDKDPHPKYPIFTETEKNKSNKYSCSQNSIRKIDMSSALPNANWSDTEKNVGHSSATSMCSSKDQSHLAMMQARGSSRKDQQYSSPSPNISESSSLSENHKCLTSSPNITKSALFNLDDSPIIHSPPEISSHNQAKHTHTDVNSYWKSVGSTLSGDETKQSPPKFSPLCERDFSCNFFMEDGDKSNILGLSSSDSQEDESNSHGFNTNKHSSVAEKSLDSLNLVPAGHHVARISKKSAKRIQDQKTHGLESLSSSNQVSNDQIKDLDHDLGSIPMHHSLQRSKVIGLNGWAISDNSIGDPCEFGSDLDPRPSRSALSKIALPRCPAMNIPLSSMEDDESEDGFEESFINQILNLEDVQKILRRTKTENHMNIKSRLLSSKIKL